MLEEELLRQEIESDPLHPGPAEVRLRRSGVHVWAVIGDYLHTVGRDKQALARDYALSEDEITPALAYYESHRAEIESRIAENELSLAG